MKRENEVVLKFQCQIDPDKAQKTCGDAAEAAEALPTELRHREVFIDMVVDGNISPGAGEPVRKVGGKSK